MLDHWRVALAAILSATAIASDSGAAPAAAADHCAALTEVALSSGRIEHADAVSGDFQPPDGAALKAMPAFCRATGTATPTPKSRIGFEVWLPLSGWSGRVHMIGNGGYSSSIRFSLMETLVRRGDVAVATDTGHRGDDLSFGFDNPDAIADWGYRAVHESIEAGKRLTGEFYGRPAKHSYFSGCSTGGHQALMSAQRFPADFDGIIAGAPGNNRTNLNLAFLWMFLQNHEHVDNQHPILDLAALKTLNRAAIAQCDRLDGVADGIIADPRRCKFDPKVTQCAPGQQSDCLSERQVAAVSGIYAGPRRAGGREALYPGWPVGSEYSVAQLTLAGFDHQGWDLYWANPKHPEEPQRVDYFRNWVFHDPAWNWWSLDWDKDVDRARAAMAAVDAVNPDLSAFKSRGGKLIMFSGWQDPVVSTYDVIDYYTGVAARNGGVDRTQSFARLFLVPGMAHCADGAGATNFSSTIRDSTPMKPDPLHDMSLALQDWLEKGRAPEHIVAAKYTGAGSDKSVAFTRMLCPYPQSAVYSGRGDQSQAENYVCRTVPP
jgi:feruloyl esterase